MRPPSVAYYPKFKNNILEGSTLFVDRQADITGVSIESGILTFRQRCVTSVSGYARLNGVDTTGLRTRAIVKVTENGTTGAVSFWTAAEAKHAGISIFHSNPDNNYILMISPAASAAGDRSVQLVKQVLGVETILDTEVLAGLQLNTDYILELYRSSGVVTGNLYNSSGTLLATVSANDTSLSTGVSGFHGYSCDYKVSDLSTPAI